MNNKNNESNKVKHYPISQNLICFFMSERINVVLVTVSIYVKNQKDYLLKSGAILDSGS